MARSKPSQLASVLHRNINALLQVRQELDACRSPSERLADAIARFTGSMWFVGIHAVIVTLWITVNLGVMGGIPRWDPYPFVMLAMAASVEAIFLSTFVLINQNRMSVLADKRAELDLQVNLLAEHEITRLIKMVEQISRRMGVEVVAAEELEELKTDVKPEEVWQQIAEVEDSCRDDADVK